jgi:hypothetical protein
MRESEENSLNQPKFIYFRFKVFSVPLHKAVVFSIHHVEPFSHDQKQQQPQEHHQQQHDNRGNNDATILLKF